VSVKTSSPGRSAIFVASRRCKSDGGQLGKLCFKTPDIL
jgi:hypothetical protein